MTVTIGVYKRGELISLIRKVENYPDSRLSVLLVDTITAEIARRVEPNLGACLYVAWDYERR